VRFAGGLWAYLFSSALGAGRTASAPVPRSCVTASLVAGDHLSSASRAVHRAAHGAVFHPSHIVGANRATCSPDCVENRLGVAAASPAGISNAFFHRLGRAKIGTKEITKPNRATTVAA